MNFNLKYVLVNCGKCDISFAVPGPTYDRWCRTHENWYFPNGHVRYYPQESEEEKLRRQLETSRRSEVRLRADRDSVERSLRSTKGHLTRYRNRAESGHCPICNAHVKELAAHMEQEHSEQGEDAA